MRTLTKGGFVAAALAAVALRAAGADWRADYDAGLSAMKRGDHERAAGLLKQAVAATEAVGPESTEAASALTGLAEVYLAQGRTTEAGLLLERSLYILAKAPGAGDAEVARVCLGLGRVRVAQERFAEAESLLSRVVAAREKTPGADFSDVAEVYLSLSGGYLANEQGPRSAEAERRALDLRRKSVEGSPVRLARALLEQAEFERWHGGDDKAEALRREALALQEKALGPDHPDVADTLMALATARMSVSPEGNFSISVNLGESKSYFGMDLKAFNARVAELFRPNEPLVRRALAIRETALGPVDPKTVEALDYLATGYFVTGDPARAEPLLKRALAAREKAVGPEDPSLLARLARQADLALSRKAYREAIPVLTRVVAIGERARKEKGAEGSDHENLLASLPPAMEDDEDDGKPGDYAEELARAVRLVRLEADPVLRPTEADLSFLKRLGAAPETTALADLAEMRAIKVVTTDLDDAGLAHIRGLVSLRRLTLETKSPGTKKSTVTDAGLDHLRRLTGLKRLDLSFTDVNGSGFDALKGLTSLERLTLGSTSVDDAGLARLPDLPALKHLDLTGTGVTDASVPRLARLTGLTHLNLIGTKMTEAGVAEVHRALPGLVIFAPHGLVPAERPETP